MAKTIFLVDGFNVYHALNDHSHFRRYKWLDYGELARKFITRRDSIEDVYLFTAFATWAPEKVKRHKVLMKALQLRGVKPVWGQFKWRDRTCWVCHKRYKAPEEKLTDVNIAVYLFELAFLDAYEKAIIVSGDTDLIPAIEAVRRIFPAKQIGVVIPIGRRSEGMKNACDFHMKMKQKHLQASRLPDVIHLGDGKEIVCPAEWR
jgi:uncharacterized LabA/DUF88 family protein